VDGDDVAVLYPKIVANDTVDASGAVIELIVSEHDEDGVLALLSLDEHRVSAEKLQCFHGSVRESDDGVVIVRGIGDTRPVRTIRN
jgi:hypothetical protein